MSPNKPAGNEAIVQPPKVSVIIANHNYEEFISDTIRSVSEQTYANFECLIVDDASSDGSTKEIRKTLRKLKDCRFSYHFLSENLGQLGAMYEGLKRTSGVFVAFLDADDIWTPEFLDMNIGAHLNPYHSASFSTCDMFTIDGDNSIVQGTWHLVDKDRGKKRKMGTTVFTSSPKTIMGNNDLSKHPMKLKYMDPYWKNWRFGATSSMVFRRDVLEQIFPDDREFFRISADYYLAVFSHLIGGTLILPERLVYYRMHQKNNFSSFPILGGKFIPGPWSKESETEKDIQIARNFLEKTPRFIDYLGKERCKHIICQLLPVGIRGTILQDYPNETKLLFSGAISRRISIFDFGKLFKRNP